ncbi:DUF6909 family protein [Vulgatibacter incomptus]|uniref:Uncharacterized protein n=1 Tax=Vulgatibacter incomptus TaxID=1391653 RepID=A0A0K1PEE7_9BACT|nr:hypothetical protein [Vulgatibacter incomptus]AKU91885.1 hypothetical protein AKJ08_2272 [Vulgatibacter incomptus]
MDRLPSRIFSDEIDLYTRTYASLLRSTGEVRVRAFEEAHSYSDSSLHAGARALTPDVAAFAYSAARLPACMDSIRLVVMGQSHEIFEAAGFEVGGWETVRTRGRRRPLRWDGGEVLAAFITSTSDIDDLVPILTAYQIEWNKLHHSLSQSTLGQLLQNADASSPVSVAPEELATVLGLDAQGVDTLQAAFGESWDRGIRAIATRRSDLAVRLLAGSFSQYQRASQRWWTGVDAGYLQEESPRRRPVYFVSSNTHSLSNLLGGYAQAHQGEIVDFARRKNPENLAPRLERALASGAADEASNILYYLLRELIHDEHGAAKRLEDVLRFDAESGISTLASPGKIDVTAQIFELSKLRPERIDPRLREEGLERLSKSNAVIVNIDYPLGMAAYHHLSRLGQGVGEIFGVYVMGKAATLNGRVGDAMISTVAYDEHSRNTYLLANCFSAADVQPYMTEGTVLDNQKVLTARGPFLQNRQYMSTFYREGYTVLEMEAGPYLDAIYELVSPGRHPNDQIVHLSNLTPFDVGILHYASDTPYSRRQSLLSKSLSYFGMESTYACAMAIARRILRTEIARLGE